MLGLLRSMPPGSAQIMVLCGKWQYPSLWHSYSAGQGGSLDAQRNAQSE